MSDIFDHPDLRDPSWAKKLKREMRRGFWRRHRWKVVAGLAVVIVMPALAVYGLMQDAKVVTFQPPSATTTGPPTTQTTVESGVKVDLAQPFVGTPAAGWSDGDAGIVVPPGAPVNGFAAAQVTDALTKAKAAFTAAYLNSRVIQAGDVEPLATLFAPDSQENLRTDPARRTRIAPGFKLLPVAPKLNGTLSVEPGEKGELLVRANYVVAYPFHIDDPGDLADVMDIVAVKRVDARYIFRDGPSFAPSSRGLWPGTVEGYTWSLSCTAAKEGFLGPAYSDRRIVPGLPGQAEKDKAAAFDPAAPMPDGSTC